MSTNKVSDMPSLSAADADQLIGHTYGDSALDVGFTQVATA
jgi:hypothetical protein